MAFNIKKTHIKECNVRKYYVNASIKNQFDFCSAIGYRYQIWDFYHEAIRYGGMIFLTIL